MHCSLGGSGAKPPTRFFLTAGSTGEYLLLCPWRSEADAAEDGLAKAHRVAVGDVADPVTDARSHRADRNLPRLALGKQHPQLAKRTKKRS